MKNYFVLMCALFIVNGSLNAMDDLQFRQKFIETLKSPEMLVNLLVDIAQSEQPDLQVAQKLVDLGVNIASDASGKVASALCIAAEKGHDDYVKFLLDNKANVEGTRPPSLADHRTALMVAVACSREKTVELLLSYKADPNVTGYMLTTPLIAASQRVSYLADSLEAPSVKVVELLLAAGANVNHKDSNFRTPLLHAKKACKEALRAGNMVSYRMFEKIAKQLEVAGGKEYRYQQLINPQGEVVKFIRKFTQYSFIDVSKLNVAWEAHCEAWDYEKDCLNDGWKIVCLED